MATIYSKNRIKAYGHLIFEKVNEIMLKHKLTHPIWGPTNKIKDKKAGNEYRIITITSDFYNGYENDHRPLITEILSELREYQCKWVALQYDYIDFPEILSLELYFPTEVDGKTPKVLPSDLLLLLPYKQRRIKGCYPIHVNEDLIQLLKHVDSMSRNNYSDNVSKYYNTLPIGFWGGLTTPR